MGERQTTQTQYGIIGQHDRMKKKFEQFSRFCQIIRIISRSIMLNIIETNEIDLIFNDLWVRLRVCLKLEQT